MTICKPSTLTPACFVSRLLLPWVGALGRRRDGGPVSELWRVVPLDVAVAPDAGVRLLQPKTKQNDTVYYIYIHTHICEYICVYVYELIDVAVAPDSSVQLLQPNRIEELN